MGGSQSIPQATKAIWKPRNTKKPSRPSGPPTWSMMPKLHDSVLQHVKPLQLHFRGLEDSIKPRKEYDTNIMGRFQCENPACSGSMWTSKKIALNIRLYKNSKYNAKIYHQRCQGCDTICWPEVDRQSYIERVAYRLKVWHGVKVETPPFNGDQKDDGPAHLSHLCEGCKSGHCKAGEKARQESELW